MTGAELKTLVRMTVDEAVERFVPLERVSVRIYCSKPSELSFRKGSKVRMEHPMLGEGFWIRPCTAKGRIGAIVDFPLIPLRESVKGIDDATAIDGIESVRR